MPTSVSGPVAGAEDDKMRLEVVPFSCPCQGVTLEVLGMMARRAAAAVRPRNTPSGHVIPLDRVNLYLLRHTKQVLIGVLSCRV